MLVPYRIRKDDYADSDFPTPSEKFDAIALPEFPNPSPA